MKNIFSKDIFKLSLKKLGLTSALLGLITIGCTAMLIANNFTIVGIGSLSFDPPIFYNDRGYTAAGIAPMLLLVMFLGSVIFTYITFNYQNKRAISDKFHSLPYTRIQQYISRVAAILVMLYSIIILTMFTAWISLNTVDRGYILKHIFLSALGYMAGSTLIVGVTATAMSFTGNAFANLTVTSVLLFLPRSILFIIGMLIQTVSFKIVNLNELNVFLNPSTNIPIGALLDATELYEYNGMSEVLITPKNIIYTFVFAVIYLFIAMLINHKRKSELAGKSFINNTLSCVFASLCAMPVIAYNGYLFASLYMLNNHFAYSLSHSSPALLLFAVILFVVIFLIYNTSIKGIVKGISVFIVTGVIAAGLIASGCLLANGLVHKSIESDKVDYVKINLSGDKEYVNTPVYTYGLLMSKDVKIYDDELIEVLINNLDIAIDNIDNISDNGYSTNSSYDFWCEFYMDNGRKIVRNIPVYTQTTCTEIADILLKNEEYSSALSALPTISEVEGYSIDILPQESIAESNELYQILLNDLSKTERELLPYYYPESVSYFSYSNGTVGSIVISGRYNDIAYINRFEINNNTPETKTAYMRKVANYNYDNFIETLDSIINNFENVEIYFNAALNIYYTSDSDTNPSSILYYSSDSINPMLSEEQLLKLCNDLNSMDFEDIGKLDYYAAVDIRINVDDDIIFIDTFVPLTDELYEYWLDAAQDF